MFRLRFVIVAALLVLVGCGSQEAAPTTQAPAAGPASQLAPVDFATSTTMVVSTPEPLATPELTHEEDLPGKAFILRDLNPDFKDAFNSDYPDVITRLGDEELQGFRCTRTYYDTSSTGDPTLMGYYDEAAQSVHPLTDATLVGLTASINNALKESEDHVVQISTCETETGQQIVLYGLGTFAASSKSYIGIVDAGKVVQIGAPDYMLYLSCQHVLAVDRSNNLYYQCSGGDGAVSNARVYRVNLVSHDEALLADCIHSPNGSSCK
jgi:hypothetical protein